MVSPKLRVTIDNEARKSLQNAYSHIKKDSLQNAEKVREKILSAIKDLADNPYRHSPDKYRVNNENNSFRAFEIHKYRVAYYVSDKEVRVIRIRHTKMNPVGY